MKADQATQPAERVEVVEPGVSVTAPGDAGRDHRRAQLRDLVGGDLLAAIREGRAPKTLGDLQLASLIGLGHTQFFKRKKRGEFAFLEIVPQLPQSNTRYSTALVLRWVNGEAITSGAFSAGRKAAAGGHRDSQSRRPGRPRKAEKGANAW
jgi:hypothetical protein